MSETSLRKVWIKRPNASPTLVRCQKDDLVDDLRDKILTKYAISLGRTIDAPDIVLGIFQPSNDPASRMRSLEPEENVFKIMEKYYPQGQTVHDALIVSVSQEWTPQMSPRIDNQAPRAAEHNQPFQAVVTSARASPKPAHDAPPFVKTPSEHHYHRRQRSKLEQQRPGTPAGIPESSNNGAASTNAQETSLRHRSTRPSNLQRSYTTHGTTRLIEKPLGSPSLPKQPPTPKISTPRIPNNNLNDTHDDIPPPWPANTINPSFRNFSRLPPTRTEQVFTGQSFHTEDQQNPINTSTAETRPTFDDFIPPINVLIVEDNPLSLRVLQNMMKRLKVRWQTAVNGQIAVDKWRQGGFHLVLMDIQMPVMNGLQATREIRRLERVNGIGVLADRKLSRTKSKNGDKVINNDDGNGKDAHDINDNSKKPDQTLKETDEEPPKQGPDEDKLTTGDGLFTSPTIVVALTASSLQSDREEALAAGCNDFLTKPVESLWMGRKIKEWGCMQALVDFDKWRQWKSE